MTWFVNKEWTKDGDVKNSAAAEFYSREMCEEHIRFASDHFAWPNRAVVMEDSTDQFCVIWEETTMQASTIHGLRWWIEERP